MMTCRSAVVVPLLGLVLLVSGCTATEPAAPPSPFPPRPAPLTLDGSALCSALTPEQKQTFGTDKEFDDPVTVGGRPSPGCSWIWWKTTQTWAVQIIEAPASDALGVPGSRVVSIDGYGAVREPAAATNYPGGIPFCQIPIDAADGRTLRVQYSAGVVPDAGDGGDPAAVERACEEATRFAGAVLDTLGN